MWLLSHRLALRKQAGEAWLAERRYEPNKPSGTEAVMSAEAVRAEAANRLERSWREGARRLKDAPWVTPAASCALAIELDQPG